jgi:hypothetical protein
LSPARRDWTPFRKKRQVAVSCSWLLLAAFLHVSTALAAAFLAGGWLREIHARSKCSWYEGTGLSRPSLSDGGSFGEGGSRPRGTAPLNKA